jgi:predicted membrane protein
MLKLHLRSIILISVMTAITIIVASIRLILAAVIVGHTPLGQSLFTGFTLILLSTNASREGWDLSLMKSIQQMLFWLGVLSEQETFIAAIIAGFPGIRSLIRTALRRRSNTDEKVDGVHDSGYNASAFES